MKLFLVLSACFVAVLAGIRFFHFQIIKSPKTDKNVQKSFFTSFQFLLEICE